MNTQAPFRVYDASAGAGKTHNLVKNYLKICLSADDSSSFYRVLAITFTNKAATEMKDRVVRVLEDLAHFPENKDYKQLAEELAHELQLSPARLAQRAQALIKNILHNYSAFSISTIDKFTNRLIRSFSRDLKLNNNYEVELDQQGILAEAIDRMIAQVERHDELAQVLTHFIESKLDEGRSPRLEKDLQEMAQSLFSEEAQPHLQLLKELEAKDFIAIYDALQKAQKSYQQKLQKSATELLGWMQEKGMYPELFSRKHFWNQVAQNAGGTVKLFTATVQKAIWGEEDFHPKAKQEQAEDILLPYEGELRQKAQSFWEILHGGYPLYWWREKLLRNIYSTALLAEIERNLEAVKEESNRLPIGDFNKIISNNLREQPAPYLFEKLGDRYRHYFVDEFQDTSRMQWENLLPLINNSLASGHSSAMIVGDAKQSIYRWRGGDVQQFLDLSNDKHPGNREPMKPEGQELYPRKTLKLEYNWRSRQEIVDFNNQFFQSCSQKLNQPDHQELFAEAHQKPKGAEGGYVAIEFLPYDSKQKQEYYEAQCQRVNEIVDDAIKRGYNPGDVTVLVRKNDKGEYLARYLMEQGKAVISPDSLKLSGSREVRVLISFLQMLNRPDARQERIEWVRYLYEKLQPVEALHPFMQRHCQSSIGQELQFLQDNFSRWNFSDFSGRSLLSKIYYLSDFWDFDLQQDPYLQTFLDETEQFENKEGSNESAFLRWWDDKGHAQSVELPTHVDAVQIMTIHKVKGLEFPVTILAFADWKLSDNSNKQWTRLNPENFAGLPAGLISMSNPPKEIEEGLEEYTALKSKYDADVALDNLNMLYVACTRAEEELYILPHYKEDKNGAKTDSQYISSYFQEYFEESVVWEKGEKLSKTAGEKEPMADTSLKLGGMKTVPWSKVLRVSQQAPQVWEGQLEDEKISGTKLHHLLAQITDSSDAEKVLQQNIDRGDFSESEREPLQVLLQQMLEHPELKKYFAPRQEVLNEHQILVPEQGRRIPDRIVLENSMAHVLDYKTGQKEPHHREQVEEYMQLLKEMGYQLGDKVLVYLGDPIETDKW